MPDRPRKDAPVAIASSTDHGNQEQLRLATTRLSSYTVIGSGRFPGGIGSPSGAARGAGLLRRLGAHKSPSLSGRQDRLGTDG